MNSASSPARSSGRWLPVGLLLAVGCVVVWSWIGATDRTTWWLESFPVFLALPILSGTALRFPLTPLAYSLIALHMAILLVGDHYTYEHVPLFDSIRDRFHLKRNDYDRVGHFAQGFVPAVVAREIFIRRRVVSGRRWVAFLAWCFCMAVSACYELLEWGTALLMGSGADKFLGSQGDPWDTQEDMFCCLIGAAAALLLVPWLHDRQLCVLKRRIAPCSPDPVLAKPHLPPLQCVKTNVCLGFIRGHHA